MFKSRSPFLIPSVPGSNLKKSNQEEKKRQMSIQPPTPKVLSTPKLAPPMTFDERFCFQLSVPAESDQTLFWAYDLTNQVINQYRRSLIFRQQQYYLKGRRQSQVYQTIYIVADSIQGYRDINGVPTNRICALHLVNIDVVIDATDQKSYDLLYKQIQDVSWDIPIDLTQLKFRIQRDDGPVLSGALSIPMVCQFDIRHSGN